MWRDQLWIKKSSCDYTALNEFDDENEIIIMNNIEDFDVIF